MDAEQITDAVRQKYADAALAMRGPSAAADACCDSSCCTTDPVSAQIYSDAELASIGMTGAASLGCGNPTALAHLYPGETVLDLGSGAGLDVLLSARRVGPTGHAYGVDMTDEMLNLAQANQQKAGVANATFLKGTIDQVPLADATVDVVISNCVINLAANKAGVLGEAFRVLKPGGRFAVSDMVEIEPLAPAVKQSLDAWAGCVAGTIPAADYLDALSAAGFRDPTIEVTREFSPVDAGITTDAQAAGKIASAFIRATKPKP